MNELLPVALVEGLEFHSEALRWILERLGHALVVHKLPTELFEAVRGGQRFALLISAHEGRMDWNELTSICDVPVLLIVQQTSRDLMLAESRDLLRGNNAVDFVTVPVSDIELHWRVSALLRRASLSAQPTTPVADFSWGDYYFSGIARTVLHRGREIRLKPREYDLAVLMFRRVNQVLTREWLWRVLGFSQEGKNSRSLDVCVSNVRRKLQLDSGKEVKLHALYRTGYTLLSCKVSNENAVAS